MHSCSEIVVKYNFFYIKALRKANYKFMYFFFVLVTCGLQIVRAIYCNPLFFLKKKYFYFSQNQDHYFKAMKNLFNQRCNI